MMKSLMITFLTLTSATALAGQPKATLCKEQAVKAAVAIFNVNNPEKSKLSVTTELVDMDHSEGGFEIWDVKIRNKDAQHSPYRMTVIIDACIVTAFAMPFAG